MLWGRRARSAAPHGWLAGHPGDVRECAYGSAPRDRETEQNGASHGRTHCDVIDEDIIPAAPSAVWRALVSEHAGQTHWWAPYWEAHPLASGPLTVGSEIDFFVHPTGTPTKLLDVHFAGRVTALLDERQASAEFFSGSTRGVGEWLLEPANGGTHLKMHFKAGAHGARAWLLDAVFGLGSSHSRFVRKGFERLKSHLAATSGPERTHTDRQHVECKAQEVPESLLRPRG